MGQVNVNIRIDEDLKKDFESFCEQTGLTLTTAVAAFMRTTVRNGELPFSITTKPEPRSLLKRFDFDAMRDQIDELEAYAKNSNKANS